MKLVLSACVVMLAALTGAAHAAPTCTFAPDASVPLGTGGDERPNISVEINGNSKSLIVDTGAPISLIKDAVADKLKLPLKPYPRTFVSAAGIAPSAIANVKTLSVGSLTGHDLSFFLVPSIQIPSFVAGTFGADFLQAWNVDFDFGGKRLNFVAPDQCNGDPVYWTKRSYVSLPLEVTAEQHLRATVQLDGKEVGAIIDTGSLLSLMDFALAAQLFGVNDEGLHTFKSLNMNGIEIERPSIIVARGSSMHGNQFLVGMPVLKKLHMYISYRDKVAYVTRADEH